MENKAAIISGGGCHGSFSVGLLEGLNHQYSKYYGVSTGSLISPLAALGEYKKLKEAYTSVRTKDITEKSAFKKNGHLNVKLVIWRALKSFIGKKKTVGESKNLRKLIDKFITKDDFERLHYRDKEVIVFAYSLSYDEVVGFSSKENSYEDFKDFIWYSANAPIVFSLEEKTRTPKSDNIEQWVDGGVKDVHVARLAFEEGAKEVHLFLHTPKRIRTKKANIKNTAHFLMRIFNASRSEIIKDDLYEAIMAAQIHKGKLLVYRPPHVLSSNSLVFNKEQMQEWYQLGRDLVATGKIKEYTDTYDFTE